MVTGKMTEMWCFFFFYWGQPEIRYSYFCYMIIINVALLYFILMRAKERKTWGLECSQHIYHWTCPNTVRLEHSILALRVGGPCNLYPSVFVLSLVVMQVVWLYDCTSWLAIEICKYLIIKRQIVNVCYNFPMPIGPQELVPYCNLQICKQHYSL